MFNIKIADVVVTFDNQYSYIYKKCQDYLTQEANNTGIIVRAATERIQYAIAYRKRFDGEIIDEAEAEFDCAHQGLYQHLLINDISWLHGVLLEKDGVGIAFTARPGVGKSTHAKFWLQAYEDAQIINGDNPLIKKTSQGFYGYGTPFCGKEGYNINKSVFMKAICFIERSNTNYVEQISPVEASLRLIKEGTFLPRQQFSQQVNFYLDLASQVNFFIIHCNLEQQAAKVAYSYLKQYL